MGNDDFLDFKFQTLILILHRYLHLLREYQLEVQWIWVLQKYLLC